MASLPAAAASSKRLVGQRVPEPEREPGGHVVGVQPAAELAVEEPRRLEDQQHDPLDGRVRGLGGLELAVDVERLLLVGQRPAERPLGELAAELANLRLAVARVVADAGQFAEVGRDVAGDLDAASVVAWSQAFETDVPRS